MARKPGSQLGNLPPRRTPTAKGFFNSWFLHENYLSGKNKKHPPNPAKKGIPEVPTKTRKTLRPRERTKRHRERIRNTNTLIHRERIKNTIIHRERIKITLIHRDMPSYTAKE